ncbi:hydrogenase maturation protease [Persicimonas caeni]|uniref:hydrogenase maturation protease n=1 Tax=Persicimonas caeni TaxID=2292766 RepID=UPI00143CCA64|nr:hydrogenase maturation protease [Persicimonas caeni]
MESLVESEATSTLVIGIGNRQRKDDAAGLAVVDQLRDEALDGVELVEHSGEAASLMDLWQGREVLVIDATSSGQPAGTIRRVDLLEEQLADEVLATCSSHAFGLAQAVELGRALGELPPRLVLYGIEGADFSHGEGLSGAVEEAVEEVVGEVASEVGSGASEAP